MSRQTTSYNTTTSGLDATIQQPLDSTGDTSRQQPPGSVHEVWRHHDKISQLFASLFMIERCQLPGLRHLFKVDEGSSVQTLCVTVFAVCLSTLCWTILNDRHQNERRRWTGRYRNWRLQSWHGVLFSDEFLDDAFSKLFSVYCVVKNATVCVSGCLYTGLSKIA